MQPNGLHINVYLIDYNDVNLMILIWWFNIDINLMIYINMDVKLMVYIDINLMVYIDFNLIVYIDGNLMVLNH